MILKIIQRIYFRLFTFYEWSQSRSKYKFSDPENASMYLFCVIQIMMFFVCSMIFVFFRPDIVLSSDTGFTNITVLFVYTLLVVINYIYFLHADRWKKIIKDYSSGGELHSLIMNRLVDCFLITLFFSMFVFGYILDNR